MNVSRSTGRTFEEDAVKPQWVCRVCGYNMIGRRPDVCPLLRRAPRRVPHLAGGGGGLPGDVHPRSTTTSPD